MFAQKLSSSSSSVKRETPSRFSLMLRQNSATKHARWAIVRPCQQSQDHGVKFPGAIASSPLVSSIDFSCHNLDCRRAAASIWLSSSHRYCFNKKFSLITRTRSSFGLIR